MSEENPNQDQKTRQFLNLLMSNQRQISAYIGVLVPNLADADDILQQTITVMWEKFNRYEMGTNFAAWGVRIAYYNILRYRREKSKAAAQFSDEFFKDFSRVLENKQSGIDETLSALKNCIPKLPPEDVKMLHLRYGMNHTVRFIAEKKKKSVQLIYHTFSRIHQILHRCIHRTLTEQDLL